MSVELVRRAIADHGRAVVPVCGTSMLPSIHSGTRVVIRPAAIASVRVGDVVAFEYRQGITIHRVAEHRGDHLVTAGDNLPLYDPPVPSSALLGRIADVAPYAGDPARPAGDGHRSVDVTVWLAGAVARVLADPHGADLLARHPRVRVRVLPSADVGPSAAVARLGGTVVGVSAAAVRAFGRYRPETTVARAVHIVLGCRFGTPNPGAADPVLAPGAVAEHWRVGTPLHETAPLETLRRTLTALTAPAGAVDPRTVAAVAVAS